MTVPYAKRTLTPNPSPRKSLGEGGRKEKPLPSGQNVRGYTKFSRFVSQSVTNEQHGIKVQTRYGFESGYSYQITSNPYRATTSANASSEDEMGWTISKTWANGSKSVVETFTGSGLPAPVGTNAASTGVVVTLRDANKTFVRDQADKWRMSETNALGQLVKVTEDPTAAVPKRRGRGPGKKSKRWRGDPEAID